MRVFAPPKEVLAAKEGSLAETPLPLLLYALLSEGRSCALELKIRQLEKRIVFEEGSPVGCSSNLLHETLGKFLVERNKLTEPQSQQALNESVTQDVPLGEVLVRKQWIAPFDLYKQMQANLALKILDCFRWVDARYRLNPEVERSNGPVKINPLQLIYTGSTTTLPFDAVAASLAFARAQRFFWVAAPPHDPTEVKFSAKDARLFQVLKGRPTFAELLEKGGFDIDQTMRRVYVLCVMGFCQPEPVGASDPAARPAQPPSSAPAPLPPRGVASVVPALRASAVGPPVLTPVSSHAIGSAPASPPSAGASSAAPGLLEEDDALRNDLTARFLEHRAKDPFDLLGVAEDASPLVLRKAFLGLADRFCPLRFRSADLKEKSEVMLLALAKAYGALTDPEQLELHRKRRSIAAEAKNKGAVRPSTAEHFKIRTQLLDASAQFAEGLRRLEAGAFRQAVEYFEYAYDIEPRAKHRSYLALSRYKLSPASHGKLALHELSEAGKAEPDCEVAWAFAGEIQRALGHLEVAEESYRKAFKLNPGNRQYPDLIKELSRQKRR